jgi:hypothetical protein
VDRAGGAAYPAEHAGALGAGQVLVTPLLQCAEDHLEFPAGRGPRPLPAGGLTGLPRPASIWMYQGGSHLLCPVSGGRAPEAAGRRGGGST